MGTLFGGFTQSNQADAESKMLSQEARTTADQTAAAEDTQRRQARQFLSNQAAAIAQSGAGFTDTSKKLQEQSAIDAELDALAIRYQGQLKRGGLNAAAKNADSRSGTALIAAGLGAGTSVLKGKADIAAYEGQRTLRRT
jgi:hypothetical protein